MEYKVVKKDPMLIMGIEIHTTNEDHRSMSDIPKLWERFYMEDIRKKIPNQKTGEVVGLYCDYEKDHTKPFALVAGCEVTLAAGVPEGLVTKKVPESKYAMFTVKGQTAKALVETWMWVWQSDLPRTYTGDIEIYPPGFHPETNPVMFLYVAIH